MLSSSIVVGSGTGSPPVLPCSAVNVSSSMYMKTGPVPVTAAVNPASSTVRLSAVNDETAGVVVASNEVMNPANPSSPGP